MVDTSSSDIVPTDIVTLSVDKFISAAKIFYIQAMTLIKLRKNYATKVSKLPSGVFRCILEYQFPMFFTWRYSEACMPILQKQEIHFPAIDKLDFNNYLVALNEILNDSEY